MFALVDCNNFYASCERAFNPSLIGRPVVVLSNNDGCVIARSNEAKAIGIKVAQPAFHIKELIEKNNVAVFSSNYNLYGDMSQRVMNTLTTFSPEIEIYSIDEAFLCLRGFNRVDLFEYANKIRKTTTKNTGIPVSVGVATTKTLAKVANHYAKKRPENNGVYLIDSDAKRVESLKDFDIGDVWGVGYQYDKFLRKYGVRTAYDLTQAPPEWVRKHMSVVGLRTQKELLGIPCHELEGKAPAKKAICTSRSFGEMQTELKVIEEAVSTFASRCSFKLRKQKTCANNLTVFLNTNLFRNDLPQYSASRVFTLPTATNSSIEIVHYAIIALRSIYKTGYRFKKAGVIVSGISSEDGVQTSLFDNIDRDKHSNTMHAIDLLNSRYGRDVVKLAAQGVGRKWKLRQEKLSPSYTTCCTDILTIRV